MVYVWLIARRKKMLCNESMNHIKVSFVFFLKRNLRVFKRCCVP